MGKVTLKFINPPSGNGANSQWWGRVWTQGGEFDDNGVFYYVLDYDAAKNSHYTGVHAFKFPQQGDQCGPDVAQEITLTGGDNSGIMHIAYDPCWFGSDEDTGCNDPGAARVGELEGAEIFRASNGDLSVFLTRVHFPLCLGIWEDPPTACDHRVLVDAFNLR